MPNWDIITSLYFPMVNPPCFVAIIIKLLYALLVHSINSYYNRCLVGSKSEGAKTGDPYLGAQTAKNSSYTSIKPIVMKLCIL